MQEKDFLWFIDNYLCLYEKYGTCYIVIKNKKILGTYQSYASAVNETLKSEDIGTFIVQYCNGEESGYTNYIATVGLVV